MSRTGISRANGERAGLRACLAGVATLLLAFPSGCAGGRGSATVDAAARGDVSAPSKRPPAPPTSPALQELLEREARRISGQVSVHVRVDGGPEAGVQADRAMPAASVIKLPLMVVLEEAWQTGSLKRAEEDVTRMRKMITVSDNPAANTIIGRLGVARVNAWLEQNGYRGTRLQRRVTLQRADPDNVVTASEMTRMLLQIARGEMVSPSASLEMRKVVLAQTRRSRIPAGLPSRAVSGNKTGTLRGIVNDVAFVEAPGGPRYALAVLVSDAGPEAKTSRAIAGLSRKVYAHLTASAGKRP